MSQVYLRNGNAFSVADPLSLNVCETLPIGVYTINPTPVGYVFSKLEDFVLPSKMYGDTEKNAARIMNTFWSRSASTGVLLAGQKGSGKTMLAKRMSQLGATQGVITIVINQPLVGEGFNELLQNVQQPAIVIFDEFEKVYDEDDQQKLLTVFDGTYSSKKLFVLTCNNPWGIDAHMHNRPGRIYYSLDFGSLEEKFIREYCEDNLNDKTGINGVVASSVLFGEFSFDMLKAMVEEMNRYGESASQVTRMLNMKPMRSGNMAYDIEVIRDGMLLDGLYSSDYVTTNPASMSNYTLTIDVPDSPPTPANGLEKRLFTTVTETETWTIDQNNLISLDPKTGSFVYGTHQPNTTIHFVRRKNDKVFHDFDSLF